MAKKKVVLKDFLRSNIEEYKGSVFFLYNYVWEGRASYNRLAKFLNCSNYGSAAIHDVEAIATLVSEYDHVVGIISSPVTLAELAEKDITKKGLKYMSFSPNKHSIVYVVAKGDIPEYIIPVMR